MSVQMSKAQLGERMGGRENGPVSRVHISSLFTMVYGKTFKRHESSPGRFRRFIKTSAGDFPQRFPQRVGLRGGL